jgi:hypothetical protein
MVTWWHATRCSPATGLFCETRSHSLLAHVRRACPAINQARLPGFPVQIGHLAEKKTGHLSNSKIPQVPDASGGFLVYTGVNRAIENSLMR